MSSLVGLKAGDSIMVPKGWRGNELEERTVSKVGRIWLYVGEEWQARKFRITDGSEENNHGRHAMTLEAYAEIPIREAAAVTLFRLRVARAPRYEIDRWVEDLPLEAVEKIIAVLDPTYFGKYADLYAGKDPKGPNP